MRRILIGGVLVCACITSVALIRLRGEEKREPARGAIPTGEIAIHVIGRLIVDASGNGQAVGYYPYIAGISGSFFSGVPGEATAFFTFRSATAPAQLIPNGNLVHWFATPPSGAVLERVYLNSSPHQDFQNPDTFSEGELIAEFKNMRFMGTISGLTGVEAGTLKLVWSKDFTFQGQTYNLRNLGHAATMTIAYGVPLSGGPTSLPVVVPFGGSAIAVGTPNRNDERSER
jgi:hypothetical protein